VPAESLTRMRKTVAPGVPSDQSVNSFNPSIVAGGALVLRKIGERAVLEKAFVRLP
jgi:hypothetical protein